MIEDRDLEEIVGRDIVGVMINPGSVSLYFNGADGRGGWILVQCRFVFKTAAGRIIGNDEFPEFANPLLNCLGKKVVDADFDERKVFTLNFENKQFLQLIPEKDGLESYVLHTAQGIIPVIDF
ncbi:hypothetical protein ACS0ZG_36285 [Burkholderia gladioli]|uniref:hypothetical protein n=3 Tax=Burkholderia gladioli TaxID=28095 RepID=UPI00163EE6E9|nr:hypothetical protein [Burkholderia gladioli]